MADAKRDLIKSVPLFATCDNRELERLGMLVDEVSLPAGRVLFNQGDHASELFIVVEGKVRVDRNGANIATRGPGEFFGEMALVSEGTRMATATCETDCRFFVLGHREFHSLMDEFPTMKMRVLETLAERVRSLDTTSVH
ncbi:MAG TPA: cyclic nucleotide-binding domain-containing protein [Candidatus Limnocylindria bacterium]|nr:cyclic nucleotide-binding domain-containing protein [Candidatus Limnocylindria bacterium]